MLPQRTLVLPRNSSTPAENFSVTAELQVLPRRTFVLPRSTSTTAEHQYVTAAHFVLMGHSIYALIKVYSKYVCVAGWRSNSRFKPSAQSKPTTPQTPCVRSVEPGVGSTDPHLESRKDIRRVLPVVSLPGEFLCVTSPPGISVQSSRPVKAVYKETFITIVLFMSSLVTIYTMMRLS